MSARAPAAASPLPPRSAASRDTGEQEHTLTRDLHADIADARGDEQSGLQALEAGSQEIIASVGEWLPRWYAEAARALVAARPQSLLDLGDRFAAAKGEVRDLQGAAAMLAATELGQAQYWWHRGEGAQSYTGKSGALEPGIARLKGKLGDVLRPYGLVPNDAPDSGSAWLERLGNSLPRLANDAALSRYDFHVRDVRKAREHLVVLEAERVKQRALDTWDTA